MRRYYLMFMVAVFVISLAVVPIGAKQVFADSHESGGYGSDEEESGGYGSDEEESGGYGSDEEESGGYGSDEEESGGYGSDEEESGGYGSDEEESGGYGSDEESSGYGEEKEESGASGSEEESSGYGEEKEESGASGSEEESSGYGEEKEASKVSDSEKAKDSELKTEPKDYSSLKASGVKEYLALDDKGNTFVIAGSVKKQGIHKIVIGKDKDGEPKYPSLSKALSAAKGMSNNGAKLHAILLRKDGDKVSEQRINLMPKGFKTFVKAGDVIFVPKDNMILFILTGLGIGLMLGWVLQRGRFCMNSAFRDTIFIQDFTYFHAYILALMVAIIGANGLMDLGLIKLTAQPFWPFAHIIGGYIFGLGIVLAGGCGSGIWYRIGEGQLAAGVAIIGFFIGIAATMSGILKPIFKASREVMLLGSTPTLYSIIGDGMMIKWGVIAVLCIAGFFWIRKSDPFKPGKQKGYYWSVTGLLLGGIAVLAFWAGDVFGGGFARGLSFTTPTIELFNTILRGDARPSIFPLQPIGFIKTTWGIFFIVGVPLGAALSAKGLKEFSWKVPPAKELLTVFGGSLMMGFGATLALGCNMGQGITGVATLSVGSIMATIAIILGNWTMVYYKFIKPMNDMDLDDD